MVREQSATAVLDGKASGSERRYLVGVQGLRTVAALLVAVYHIWLGRVSGGVDVFFVVAGFFAVGSLLRALSGAGSSREILKASGSYLLRTMRRVVPSSVMVLATTVAAAMFLMPQAFWETNVAAGWAALTFTENWFLVSQATDYLAQEAAAPAFQQYWALAVNVQFYVGAAVLFGFVALLVRKRPSALPKAVGFTVTAVGVASFVYSVSLTASNQPAAYFDTFTRLWEFMAGAGLYLFLSSRGGTAFSAQALGFSLGMGWSGGVAWSWSGP